MGATEVSDQNPLRHNEVTAISSVIRSRIRGRMKDDPGRCSSTMPGSDPDNLDSDKERAMPHSMAAESAVTREHAIALLDSVRSDYETSRLNRVRYMVTGREAGLSSSEIAAILGITESAVRHAIRKANGAFDSCHAELPPQQMCSDCGTYNPNGA